MSIVIHGRPSGRPVLRADHFDVQLRMVDVANLERAVSMAWRSRLQLKIEVRWDRQLADLSA